MVHWYPSSTRPQEEVVVFLHIYEAKAVSLLFFNHQDIEFEKY